MCSSFFIPLMQLKCLPIYQILLCRLICLIKNWNMHLKFPYDLAVHAKKHSSLNESICMQTTCNVMLYGQQISFASEHV